jgi:predicted SnoaL-like aldol condensation-catalyzing enzyme
MTQDLERHKIAATAFDDRFDANGKIVEHWDVLQRVPEHSENPNSMF